MKRLWLMLFLLVAAGCLLAASSGCAGSSGSSGGYYSRGTIHRDSFPTPGGPGSPYRHYGRPRRYRY